MKVFEIIVMVLVLIIVAVWGLSLLNGFIGGNSIFMYIGTPVALGVFVIVAGFMISQYTEGYVMKN